MLMGTKVRKIVRELIITLLYSVRKIVRILISEAERSEASESVLCDGRDFINGYKSEENCSHFFTLVYSNLIKYNRCQSEENCSRSYNDLTLI